MTIDKAVLSDTRRTYDLNCLHESIKEGSYIGERVTVLEYEKSEYIENPEREIVLRLHTDISATGSCPNMDGVEFTITESRLRLFVELFDKIDNV